MRAMLLLSGQLQSCAIRLVAMIMLVPGIDCVRRKVDCDSTRSAVISKEFIAGRGAA